MVTIVPIRVNIFSLINVLFFLYFYIKVKFFFACLGVCLFYYLLVLTFSSSFICLQFLFSSSSHDEHMMLMMFGHTAVIIYHFHLVSVSKCHGKEVSC